MPERSRANRAVDMLSDVKRYTLIDGTEIAVVGRHIILPQLPDATEVGPEVADAHALLRQEQLERLQKEQHEMDEILRKHYGAIIKSDKADSLDAS